MKLGQNRTGPGQRSVRGSPRHAIAKNRAASVRIEQSGCIISDTHVSVCTIKKSRSPSYHIRHNALTAVVLRYFGAGSFCERKGLARDVMIDAVVLPRVGKTTCDVAGDCKGLHGSMGW